MPCLRHLAVICVFLAAFARPAPASAFVPASAGTCVERLDAVGDRDGLPAFTVVTAADPTTPAADQRLAVTGASVRINAGDRFQATGLPLRAAFGTAARRSGGKDSPPRLLAVDTIDGFGRVLSHKTIFDDPAAGYVARITEMTAYSDATNTTTAWQLLDATAGTWTRREVVHDGAGRVLKETAFRQLTGKPDAVTTYQYDAAGLLHATSVPSPTSDVAGAFVTYTLDNDALGRPISLRAPDGSGSDLAYAGLDRTVTEVTPTGTGSITVYRKDKTMQPAGQPPVKDEDSSTPIAEAWRPALREVVKALAEGDYDLSRGIPSVALQRANADQIRAYLADYGETLAELPDETWQSSISQWMGTHWDILVDLWTVESGQSDLVLSLRVFESDNGFRFEVDSLHVP